MNHDFFLSDENLVGASPNAPFHFFADCLGITGLGEGKNRTAISTSKGSLIIQANNENLVWMNGCIHRFRSSCKHGYGPLALKRAFLLQEQVNQMLSDSKPQKFINGKSIFLGHAFGWHAFGHIHDTLQRLFYFRGFDSLANYKFIVNRYDRIVDFKSHLNAVVGHTVPDENIIILDNAYDYRFENLYYSHSPAVMTSYTDKSLKWINRAYRTKFSRQGTYPKILLLSRNTVRPGKRGIKNEGEIIELLDKYDSKVVYGTESLEQIMNLFMNAKFILGTHGSLLSNSFICSQNCKILELCPRTRIDVTQRNKKKFASYNQLLLDSDSNYNILVEPKIIYEFLEGGVQK